MEKGFVRKLWKFPTETQREMLRASGLSDGDIYEVGSGEEDFDACLMSFRGRAGTLKIAADMRVFGENQQEITKAVDKCELQGIRIMDLAHPELKTISAQQRWAFARLAEWKRWGGDKKRARRTGAQGAAMRAINAAIRRAEKIPEESVRALINLIGKRLTWKDVSDATGISVGSLRRHYWVKPEKPKSRKARK